MTEYFEDYITVFVFAAMGAALVGAGIGFSALLRPDRPNPSKSKVYECGIDPVGGGWSQTHIRYYIFALLFLIFDVEAVFIFPWAIRLEGFAGADLGMLVLVEMIVFIVILLMGLVYAIRKGVLRWE